MPPGRQALEDLRLGLRDRVDRGEELEVHGGDPRDHRHVGLGERGSGADLAGGRHAQLEHRRRVLGPQAQQGEGQAVLVVEVALGLAAPAPRVASRCAVMSLVVVLPTEPVTPTTGIAARRRTCRARSASARVVSATRTSGEPGGRRRRRGGRPRPPRPAPRPRPGSRGRRAAGRGSRRRALPARACASRSTPRRRRAPGAAGRRRACRRSPRAPPRG